MIRTRRVPFYKSRPSRPLLATTLACAAFGVAIPYIPPLAHLFGFPATPTHLPCDPDGDDRHLPRARPNRRRDSSSSHRAANPSPEPSAPQSGASAAGLRAGAAGGTAPRRSHRYGDPPADARFEPVAAAERSSVAKETLKPRARRELPRGHGQPYKEVPSQTRLGSRFVEGVSSVCQVRPSNARALHREEVPSCRSQIARPAGTRVPRRWSRMVAGFLAWKVRPDQGTYCCGGNQCAGGCNARGSSRRPRRRRLAVLCCSCSKQSSPIVSVSQPGRVHE